MSAPDREFEQQKATNPMYWRMLGLAGRAQADKWLRENLRLQLGKQPPPDEPPQFCKQRCA